MITITHTHEAGTLVDGTSRGDGTAEILKPRRFRWSRNLGSWYLPHSRDKAAQTWVIGKLAEALREAGHEVTTEVDDSQRRTFAEAEAERYERAEGRADYHAEVAGSAAAKSDAAWQAEHQILDMIPMGQPILVGHHSERRHRRDLERAESLRRRGQAEEERAGYHADRADTAAKFQARRESIPTTLRRIKKLEAEERDIQRRLAGRLDYYQDEAHEWKSRLVKPGDAYRERLETLLTDVREQLAYWREHVKAAEAAGVKIWTRADFTRGDYVRFLGTWYEVVRVSAKSVTIPAMINDGPIVHKDGNRCTWTDTIPYDKVTGRKSAEEIAAIMAEAERREAQEATA